MKVEKSIDEINERIREGSVCVVTADEMSELVEEKGAEEACLLYTSPSPRDRG